MQISKVKDLLSYIFIIKFEFVFMDKCSYPARSPLFSDKQLTYNRISILWSNIYFMMKERQHFNSFKAMYNSLYTLHFTLIIEKSCIGGVG